MTTSRLPVWRLVTLSYVDICRALKAMPLLFAFAAMIILAVRIVAQALPQRFETGLLLGAVSSIVQDAVQYFCLTPIMVAIHRFVIRGDVTRGYAVNLGDEAFMPFFAWTAALSIIFSLIFAATNLLDVKTYGARPSLMAIALVIAAFAAAVWLVLRLIVLFPAIAVGAKGATAANAFADTKGHGLRLLAIFILSFVPVLVLALVFMWTVGRGVTAAGSVNSVAGELISSVMAALNEAIGVVVASHVFLAIGRKVR